MKIFLSYRFDPKDELFVAWVYFYLRKQPDVEPYFAPHHGRTGILSEELGKAIDNCGFFVFFWGSEIGETQCQEGRYALRRKKDNEIIPIRFPDRCAISELDKLWKLADLRAVDIDDINSNKSALQCAQQIIELLGKEWLRDDGLPIGYPFEYEKDIIEKFIRGDGELPKDHVLKGCPAKWPKLVLLGKQSIERPESYEDEIGTYRDWDKENKHRKDPRVIPVALSDYHDSNCLLKSGLTFSEAGPRKFHYYPRSPGNSLRVGILVSGGIAPGINAVISGMIKRQLLYAKKGDYELDILGYPEGFKPLILRGQDKDSCPDYKILHSTSRNISIDLSSLGDEGGSILTTSRTKQLTNDVNPKIRGEALENIVRSLRNDGVKILYVIGGDGSMKAAHAVWNCSKNMSMNLSVVAVPKTMDNDILWVWQSFGFLSAVEWAKGAVRQLYKEVTANPRVGVIQLFGSDSGFVVSHAALASGVCDLALIPESNFKMTKIVKYVKDLLRSRFQAGQDGKSPYCIILMAENAIPRDAEEYLNLPELGLIDIEKEAIKKLIKDGWRVYGKTPDALRKAGLKIVSGVLQKRINDVSEEDWREPYWKNFEVVTNEPRHLIRSIPPSSSDIIFGERLGSLAVDCGIAGYTDFMIGQWLTEYVMVPLQLVVLGRKRVPINGIFWKSVIAKTNQPAKLA